METTKGQKEETIAEQLVTRLRESSVGRNACFDPSQLKRPRLKQRLKESWWDRAAKNDGKETKILDSWFERIWELHVNKGRAYHTAVHLDEMLSYFELLCGTEKPMSTGDKNIAEGERAIILSTFFHDAIYDGTSSTNEEDSAQLFQEFAGAAGWTPSSPSASLVQRVVDMILATKKHTASPSEDPFELLLFLDLDMSVLGKQPDAYRAYTACIRTEYIHYPKEAYCQGRASILASFLQQQHIFATSLFRAAFETQARSNIEQEIAELKAGRIYGHEESSSN